MISYHDRISCCGSVQSMETEGGNPVGVVNAVDAATLNSSADVWDNLPDEYLVDLFMECDGGGYLSY